MRGKPGKQFADPGEPSLDRLAVRDFDRPRRREDEQGERTGAQIVEHPGRHLLVQVRTVQTVAIIDIEHDVVEKTDRYEACGRRIREQVRRHRCVVGVAWQCQPQCVARRTDRGLGLLSPGVGRAPGERV